MVLKAEREELAAVDTRLGGRISNLEAAILKGLKAVSNKVSTALAAKADLSSFSEFRAAVSSELADIERRLRGWNATASGQKAPTDGSSGPTCLSCDARVRGARDLQVGPHSLGTAQMSPGR